MSIVEETLNRLKTTDDAASGGDIALPPGLGELPSGRKPMRRIVLWSSAFVLAGVAIWIAADRLGRHRSDETVASFASVAPTAPPAATPSSPPKLTEPTQAGPSEPAIAASHDTTGQAAAAPQPAAATSPAAQPAAETSPAVQPASPSLADGTTAATSVAASGENRSAKTAPAWVAEGRRQLLAGDRPAALATWNKGFSALDTKTRLIALSAYPDAPGALTALARLDAFDGAFVAKAGFRGKPAWRVLLFADAKNRQEDLRLAVARLGIKGGSYVPVARLLPADPKPASVAAAPQTSATAHAASAAAPISSTPAPDAPAPAVRDFDAASAPLLAALDRNAPDAVDLAQSLLEAFPDRVEPRLWLARALLLAGRAAEAEAPLAVAAQRAPALAEIWLLRGLVAQERGQTADALAFFEEAQRLAPKRPDVLFNLALALRDVGQTVRARDLFRQFLEVSAADPRYAQQRALAQRESARIER